MNMSMTEWESPIPVWIDSISIDMDDELSLTDLSPINMDGTPTSCSPGSNKTHNFITCSISAEDQHSLFGNLLDDKSDDCDFMLDVQDIKVVAVSPVKVNTPTEPSISPVKPTAKPGRRPRRKVDVDPSGSNQRRKDKQRGYERGYRSRMKTKRSSNEAEWIQLETQVRKMLSKRTSVVALGALNEHKTALNLSTVSIRQRYLELLQEEQALRESEALDSSILAGYQAMTLWGGATATSREIREQLNGLPSLRECHTFEFTW